MKNKNNRSIMRIRAAAFITAAVLYLSMIGVLHAGAVPQSTNHEPPTISSNPFRYSGYYQDDETGMYYLKARYYDPETMRFITMDTYDLPNRYNYCDGDPVHNIDPEGHVLVMINGKLVSLSDEEYKNYIQTKKVPPNLEEKNGLYDTYRKLGNRKNYLSTKQPPSLWAYSKADKGLFLKQRQTSVKAMQQYFNNMNIKTEKTRFPLLNKKLAWFDRLSKEDLDKVRSILNSIKYNSYTPTSYRLKTEGDEVGDDQINMGEITKRPLSELRERRETPKGSKLNKSSSFYHNNRHYTRRNKPPLFQLSSERKELSKGDGKKSFMKMFEKGDGKKSFMEMFARAAKLMVK